MIAKVEPLTSARALRGPFDYRIPERMSEVGVGAVLVVPFGRRRVLGVVTAVAESSEVPPDRLVEPLEALEGGVPRQLVQLGLWVAAEYCSTPARGLALVLPPGTGLGGGRRVRERLELTAALTDAGRAAVGEDSHGPRLGPRQRAALELLSGAELRAAKLTRRARCSHASLRRLEELGLVELTDERVRRRPHIAEVGARGKVARLTDAQQASLDEVIGALDAGESSSFLLHGVTGSGKTEVYLRAVAATLERGRSAIVLVPEIALTPQTAGRFEERFGDAVAILHSRLSAGERYDEWMRMRRGEARVCVGPRSAVFAPFDAPGLIVVDEEHDSSYKQESDPRYDARDVAARRAAEAGAVLLSGSATPRAESFERVARLNLPERVDGRGLPPVEVVGMADTTGPLHERTRAALEEVRSRGQKAVVLLNRRGWSAFLSCRSCGRVWECPQCDVSLVLHRAADRMSCHHCGHAERAPSHCPDCGSASIGRHGVGTERLEGELAELVHPMPVLRLDSDTAAAAGRDGIAAVLEQFDRAESGVLLGTQMVAKGHDFAEVTLGVVLDADATLRFPDFRAEERTFALVAQLAGRSGRGPAGGRVVVQALDPTARALAHAGRHDSNGFLVAELERRRALGYPPFAHLIRLICSSEESGPELEAAGELARGLTDSVAEASVLGPAPLFRLRGRERAQVLVKAPERRAAVEAVRAAVEAASAERSRRGVAFSVDVDPQ